MFVFQEEFHQFFIQTTLSIEEGKKLCQFLFEDKKIKKWQTRQNKLSILYWTGNKKKFFNFSWSCFFSFRDEMRCNFIFSDHSINLEAITVVVVMVVWWLAWWLVTKKFWAQIRQPLSCFMFDEGGGCVAQRKLPTQQPRVRIPAPPRFFLFPA